MTLEIARLVIVSLQKARTKLMSETTDCSKQIFASAQDAVLHAAYSLSDAVSVSGGNFKLSAGMRNVWDMSAPTKVFPTPRGAIAALNGLLSSGCLSSAILCEGGVCESFAELSRLSGLLSGGVVHAATASVSTNAHSVDGDLSDAMSARGSGAAILFSANNQEAYDFAVIAHLAALKTKIPFLHIFQSENASHEINKISVIPQDKLRQLLDESAVREFRSSLLSPEHPIASGLVYDSETYFQSRESVSRYYETLGELLQREMDKFAKLTGRQYHAIDFEGSKEASKLIIISGNGADTVSDTVNYLNQKGEKTAVIKVRLFRPLCAKTLVGAIPKTVRFVSVLDCTKEAGSDGEPLYKDVCASIAESARRFAVISGGRFAIGGKSFTPASVAAVFDNMTGKALNHFSVGITDDIGKSSLDVDKNFNLSRTSETEVAFYGTQGDLSIAEKKIVETISSAKPEWKANIFIKKGAYVWGSPKLFTLRMGKEAKSLPYMTSSPDFVICSQMRFALSSDLLLSARENAVFILNSPYSSDEVWNYLPSAVQNHIIERKMKFFVINAAKIAESEKARIGDIMLLAYFKTANEFSENEIAEKLQEPFSKIAQTVFSSIREIMYPAKSGRVKIKSALEKANAPYVRDVLSLAESFSGSSISVGKLNADGTCPTGVSKYEKKGETSSAPVWNAEKCSQCGECAFLCPRSAIRMNILPETPGKHMPKNFPMTTIKPRSVSGKKITLQVSIDDCTACGACASACKEDAITLTELTPELKDSIRENWQYFQKQSETDSLTLDLGAVRDIALKTPLFEYVSTAEPSFSTTYLKLLSQLFGNRAIITGAHDGTDMLCASLPSIPFASDEENHGIAWGTGNARSEAEYALSLRIAYDSLQDYAKNLAERVLVEGISVNSIRAVLDGTQKSESEIDKMRKNIAVLKKYLSKSKNQDACELSCVADNFIRRSIWLVCTQQWAETTGFSGLNEIFESARNINILVLSDGKKQCKNLIEIAMTYPDVYVASISACASSSHTLKALREADDFEGTSIVIADCRWDFEAQKDAVKRGEWALLRFDPRRKAESKNPLQLDSQSPMLPSPEVAAVWKKLKYLADQKW